MEEKRIHTVRCVWAGLFVANLVINCAVPLSAKIRVIYFFAPRYELRMSAFHGDVDGIRASLNRGAKIDAREGYAGRNALMVAALHGHNEAVSFLIARGADVDAKDDKGLTARQLAEKDHYPETAALLARCERR